MRLLAGLLFTTLTVSGCVEVPPTSAEQYQADMRATGSWIRGPLLKTCAGLPSPDSQRACAMSGAALADLPGTPVTHQELFRIELAKAKATDELRSVWTQTDQEAWLRGPRTRACQHAPLAAYAERCLKSVQDDLDALRLPDEMPMDPPAVRAERAVVQIETNERQRIHDLDVTLEQAVGQALMVVGVGGGLFGTSTATLSLEDPSQPVPQLPLTSLTPSPPVSCTSQKVGQIVYTNCR